MAPKKKQTRMDRAKKERMYFMGRAAASSDSAASFIVTGQSGKVWTVSLPGKSPSAAGASSRMSRFRCNCPDNLIRKGTCKISEEQLDGLENGGELDVGFLHEVLEKVAPEVDDEYCAPAALKERLKSIAGDFEANGESEVPKVQPRMPEEGEACPICYDDLLDDTPLIHCGYGCGKPVHVECFERYKKAQNQKFGRSEIGDCKLRCVTCRMDWEIQPTSNIIGSRGMLVGRRAIDLAQAMPEVFENNNNNNNNTPPAAASSSSKSKSKSKSVSKKGRPSKRKASTKVKGGRVTKAKTEGGRKSSRIANRKNPADGEEDEDDVEAAPLSKRKATRKVASKKMKIATKVESKKVTIKKKTNIKSPIAKRAKRGKSGWANAVEMPDADAAERASVARSSRAARRSARSTRRTRSQAV